MKATEALKLFIRSRIAANCRSSTIDNYQRRISHFIKSHQITDMDAVTCDVVRDYLATRKTSGIKASTVVGNRAMIITWLTWLTVEGHIPDTNWNRRISKVKQDKKKPRALTEEECKLFLQTARHMSHKTRLADTRDIAMLYTFLDTGVRLSELINMTLADLDLEHTAIRIAATAKDREERTVWFGLNTAKLIKRYLKVRGRNKSPYLWITRDSDQPSKSLILQIVKRIARAAGLDKVSVHTLRRTFVTLCIDSNMPISHVQHLVGHSDPRTTAGYVDVRSERVRKSYQDRSPMDLLG